MYRRYRPTQVFMHARHMQTGSFAAAAWSRRTLVHTAATTAASETGALLSSTAVPPPAPPPSPESDGGAQSTDSGDSGASAADTEELSSSVHEQRDHPDDRPTTCQGDRSDDRSDEHEVSLACPRSPGCSTRSGGSGSGVGSHSAAGVAAALPTPPATPGHPYAVRAPMPVACMPLRIAALVHISSAPELRGVLKTGH